MNEIVIQGKAKRLDILDSKEHALIVIENEKNIVSVLATNDAASELDGQDLEVVIRRKATHKQFICGKCGTVIA